MKITIFVFLLITFASVANTQTFAIDKHLCRKNKTVNIEYLILLGESDSSMNTNTNHFVFIRKPITDAKILSLKKLGFVLID